VNSFAAAHPHTASKPSTLTLKNRLAAQIVGTIMSLNPRNRIAAIAGAKAASS
jgi:hypothetical protein